MRRDEDDAIVAAEDYVAGHDCGTANAHWAVDPGQHDGGRGKGGVKAAHKTGELRQLLDAVDIADGRVVDHPVARIGIDSGGEVVANDGALVDFAEYVGHVHVPGH